MERKLSLTLKGESDQLTRALQLVEPWTVGGSIVEHKPTTATVAGRRGKGARRSTGPRASRTPKADRNK